MLIGSWTSRMGSQQSNSRTMPNSRYEQLIKAQKGSMYDANARGLQAVAKLSVSFEKTYAKE